jgi:cytochrome c
MKKMSLVLSCVLAALSLSTAVHAQTEADALFASKICFACHSVTKDDFKRVGPYVVDIAAKYKGQTDASKYLKQKVLQGSSGVWGPADSSIMPANKVTEAEADMLVAWLLSK